MFLLCGCVPNTTSLKPEENTVSVILPDNETEATVNGYLFESSLEKNETNNAEYFANKNTKKFHLPNCRYVKSIKQENLLKSSDRSLLIGDGYIPCKNCNP